MNEERRSALRHAFDILDEQKRGTLAFEDLYEPLHTIGIKAEFIDMMRSKLAVNRADAMQNIDFEGFCSLILVHDGSRHDTSRQVDNGIRAITNHDRFPFALDVRSRRIRRLVDEYALPELIDERSKVVSSNSQLPSPRISRFKQRASARTTLPTIGMTSPSKRQARSAAQSPRVHREAQRHRARQLSAIKVIHRGTCETAEELAWWLSRADVDTLDWGTGSLKSVEDLWREIEDEDCTAQLIDGKCVRVVSIVKVVVRAAQAAHLGSSCAIAEERSSASHLVKVREKMSDGRVRSRNTLPTSKIKRDDSPLIAAQRALCEEFGTLLRVDEQARLLEDSLLSWYEFVDSPSFPTLITQYRISQVVAVVGGLPPGQFTTTEGLKEHTWQWVADAETDGAARIRAPRAE